MALRVAVASGNWSNPATWSQGVIPTIGDNVGSNTYTITIDQNINVALLTNTALSVVTAVPVMTSNTTPSGIVTASFANGLFLPAWQAFDGSTSSNFFQAVLTPGDFIAYEFASPIAIDQFGIVLGGTTTSPVSVTAQGWNGTVWVDLLTVSITTSTTSSLFGNSTPYIKYRLLFNSAVYIQIREVRFFEFASTTPATAGGEFILGSGVTVTCTSSTGISSASNDCLIFSGSGTSTINSNISPPTVSTTTRTLVHNGLGTLTINGTLINNGATLGVSRSNVTFSGSGILNINGQIQGLQAVTALNITGTGTCNIIGNLIGSNAGQCIAISSAATVNVTGDIQFGGGSTATAVIVVSGTNAILNFTGNIGDSLQLSRNMHGINLSSTCSVSITGNIYAGGNGSFCGVNSNATSTLNIIGTLFASLANNAVISSNASSINMLSGPFISNEYAMLPFFIKRMNYIKNTNSYLEFRDSSTNGAFFPGPIAPAARLLDAGSFPIPANVRDGITYGAATFVGTLKVPPPNTVSIGVPTDNTTGTALLTPQGFWDYATANLTTPGSIGERLKNVSTVDTTGDQLTALL